MTASSAAIDGPSSPASCMAQMLSAAQLLPDALRRIFKALFMDCLTDEQACAVLNLSPEAFADGKTRMLRSLKGAAQA